MRSRWGYVVSSAVPVLGVAVGVLLVLWGVAGYFGQFEEFQRSDVPGRREIAVASDESHTIYYERSSGVSPAGELGVEVTVQSRNSEDVELVLQGGTPAASTPGPWPGVVLANFSVERPGRYVLTTRSSAGATGEVTVGRVVTKPFVARAVAGVAIALLGVLVGSALALVTFFRRRSMSRMPAKAGLVAA